MGLALYSPPRGDPVAGSTDLLFAGCSRFDNGEHTIRDLSRRPPAAHRQLLHSSVGRTGLQPSLHAACVACGETLVSPVCDCQDPPPRRLSPPSLQRQGAFRAAWTTKTPRRTAVLVPTSRSASPGDGPVPRIHSNGAGAATGQPWPETKTTAAAQAVCEKASAASDDDRSWAADMIQMATESAFGYGQ